MDKKNTYLQIGKFYPPQWGGIETVTYNLEEALTNQGYENSVLVYGIDNASSKNSLNNKNIIRCKYKSFLGAPYSVEYFRIFKKISNDYSHIICHIPNPWMIFCLLMSFYKGKVILYWHSDVVNKGILGFLLMPFELWLIKRASVVIAPTTAHIEFSKYSSKFKKKYKVVPYPISKNIYAIAENNSVTKVINKNFIRIIGIGRLVEYKGFEFLIRAMPLLPKTIKYQLDIIGNGALKNHLNELIIKLNLQQSICILDSVGDDRLNELLSKAHIFCFPSNTKAEMFGMVQYEAMAYGLPIIGTDILESGAPLILRESGAGLVVTPNSSKEIASALMKIVSDEVLYSELSSSGIEAIKNKFRPEVLIGEFCKAADSG